MALYKVSIERSIMVVAENEDEAQQVALLNETEECGNDAEFIDVSVIKSIDDIPEPWMDSLPYKHEYDYGHELTCKEYLEK